MRATLPRILGCAVLAAVTAIAPAAASYAQTGPPVGRACSFVSTSDPTGETWSGEINGGPLAAPGSEVSIRCAIHVGFGNGTHAGAAVVAESAGPARDVVVLEPRQMSYAANGWDPVYVCTSATVDGTAWYWDGQDWTTDQGAPCVQSTTVCEDSGFGLVEQCLFPVLEEVYWLGVAVLPPDVKEELWDPAFRLVGCVWYGIGFCSIWEVLDPPLCALYGQLAPGVPGIVDVLPEGDVFLLGEMFWDCPPYGV